MIGGHMSSHMTNRMAMMSAVAALASFGGWPLGMRGATRHQEGAPGVRAHRAKRKKRDQIARRSRQINRRLSWQR